jgi:hypothetical protein
MKVQAPTSFAILLSGWIGALLLLSDTHQVTAFTSRVSPKQASWRELHRFGFRPLAATVAETTAEANSQSPLNDLVLKTMEGFREESNEYADMFGLTLAEAAFYALFGSLRRAPVTLGLHGSPFCLRNDEIQKALQQETNWPGFFTMEHLEKAIDEDFLDAARGTTDNRKGWKISPVSVPRGDSFEEARMSFEEVQTALTKGTVVFNSAGAHIPRLAGPSLACTDATLLPCAVNLYVTDAGKRTSAPPHTDKQDVMVVQTSGRKVWKVFSPPDPAMKPSAEMFARGKGNDALPLYALESELNCELLLETTLNPGDVLFIPAAFPHTTTTIMDDDAATTATQDTSIHLTFGIDHHIWGLDYLSVRRLALRRALIKDTALGKVRDEDNHYVGACNELADHVRRDLFAPFPMGLLDDDDAKSAPLMDTIVSELERISQAVDQETAAAVEPNVWRETAERIRSVGVELLEIHRDMYLAALEEGRTREAEDAMTAHLTRRVMTPERMQRLSLFRVKGFFDRIDVSQKALNDWSYATMTSSTGAGASSTELPANWAFVMPVNVGDKVEADLGGAFFPATVTRAADGTFDVHFFDDDQETGLDRSQIKLLSPPAVSTADKVDEVDTSKMTPKQLKRWKKAQAL